MSFVLQCLKVFAACANFPVHQFELAESMRKFNLTTKRTKDTKGSDTYTLKLRALRVLRGDMSVHTLVAALPRCALRGKQNRAIVAQLHAR